MSQRPKSFDDAINQLEDLAPGTRDRFKDEIDRLGDLWAEFRKAGGAAKEARGRAERELQLRPWLTLGLVGLLGILVGFFLARKGRR